jgi:tRNA(Arg) A34 adenosine deaminase TadA
MGPQNIAKYLDLALQIARQPTNIYADYSMGCVIVKSGKIIATGANEPFNAIAQRIMSEHQQYIEKDYISVHAEIKAATSTSVKSIKRAWVFVNGLATRSGNPLSCSRPCPNCEAILAHLGVRAVSWIENGNIITMFPRRNEFTTQKVA